MSTIFLRKLKMPDSWTTFVRDLSCYRYEINGHPTDFSRTSKYLTEIIKQQFPINEVPPEIADSLKELHKCLTIAEDRYEETIETVLSEVRKAYCPSQVPPKIFEE
jgi:hypothetical protein